MLCDIFVFAVSVKECSVDEGKCSGVIVNIPESELSNFDKREIGNGSTKPANKSLTSLHLIRLFKSESSAGQNSIRGR